MRIFRGFDQVQGIRNPVVTTGSFDGVHIGHKTILNRLRMLAEKHDGESVLITFDPHPRKVLYPETAGKDLKLINSQEEKLELLRKAGLSNLIIVEFTREFSQVTSEEFVRDFLYEKLHAKVVVVGFNHHFGFNKEGDYKHLWNWKDKYHFEAEEIPEQEVQHETVSSTRIRKAISEGYMQRANAYLDHYYMVMGIPVKYKPESDSVLPPFLDIPITEECKLLPATGIYAVSVTADSFQAKAMAVILHDGPGKPRVLVSIFGDENYFAGKTSIVLFHKMIHGTISLTDSSVIQRLERSQEEISDLIY
jgi:riboflavin kinase / FMN adenylyltransferase